MIVSDQTLMQLAEMRPSQPASLARVQGFTAAKIAKYGEVFLGVVRQFCAERGAKPDDFPEEELLLAAAAAGDDLVARSGLPTTVQDTYR